jgi:hypothetical protein
MLSRKCALPCCLAEFEAEQRARLRACERVQIEIEIGKSPNRLPGPRVGAARGPRTGSSRDPFLGRSKFSSSGNALPIMIGSRRGFMDPGLPHGINPWAEGPRGGA